MFFKKIFGSSKIELPELIDLRSDSFFTNPYPIYEGLRKDRPIAPVSSGGYLLSRHEDVYKALSSGEFGNAPSRFSALHPKNKEKYTAAMITGNIVPFLDPPNHTRPRRILAKTFHPAFKEFAPNIAEIANVFVEKAQKKGRLEVIHDLAEPYALMTMCRFLGVPDADAGALKPLGESFFYLFAPLNDPSLFEKLNKEMDVFRNYFQNLVQQRRQTLSDDLTSKMIKMDHDGEYLSDEEIADHLILLFADGVENIQYAIGNVLSILAHHQADFDRLAYDQDYLKGAIGEAIRLDPPAQTIPRIVHADTELHGASLKVGTPLFLAIGSANRDTSIFKDADMFKPERDLTKILSFGAGKHSCIGGMFGTAQILELVKALALYKVNVNSPYSKQDYHHRFAHRWPRAVEISFPS